MTKIYIIAGEASGDQLGAALLHSLKKSLPDVEIRGIGGPKMLASGLTESLFPMEELSVMGLAEVLPRIPKFLNLIGKAVQAIRVFDPDVVITIDAPDFSFRVQEKLKKLGVAAKRIHYVAPTVWAWRAGRAHKVAQFLDGMICLFPFEPIYFEKEGLRAAFAGHPVMQSPLLLSGNGQSFRDVHHIDHDTHVVGLFCGSRRSELDVSVPLYREVMRGLIQRYEHLVCVVPTLPKWHGYLEQEFKEFGSRVIISSSDAERSDAFHVADTALAVSGTVALEIALIGIPHAIIYRMNKLTWEIVRRVVKTKFAHLGNILFGHQVYPEFIQDNATAENILPTLERLITDVSERRIQVEGAKRLHIILAPDPNENAADRAAAFVLAQLDKP